MTTIQERIRTGKESITDWFKNFGVALGIVSVFTVMAVSRNQMMSGMVDADNEAYAEANAKAEAMQNAALAFTKKMAAEKGWNISDDNLEKVIKKYYEVAFETKDDRSQKLLTAEQRREVLITLARNKMEQEQWSVDPQASGEVLRTFVAEIDRQNSKESPKQGQVH